MEIPFVGGSYTARSSDFNSQTCINLYPVLGRKDENPKAVAALYGTPGLKEYVDIGTVGPLRGMHVMGDYLYAVRENTVYEIQSASASALTITLESSSGPVYMAHNASDEVLLVDGDHTYRIASSTVTNETDDNSAPVGESCCFQDGYFILNEASTQKIWISALNDGTSWNALDYASAEGLPDNLLRVFSTYRELVLMGKRSIEYWYNSGNADFPFERIDGAFVEIGLHARASAAFLDATIFWLADDLTARYLEGYNPIVISTPQIEYQWSKYDKTDDAIGYAYIEEGHAFYVLTFPTENATWVFDASTQLWHERRSYPVTTANRHRSNCYAYFEGKHLVGDYENGKIYEMDLGSYTDDDYEIVRQRRAKAVTEDRKYLFHHKLEIDIEGGVGRIFNDGSTTLNANESSGDTDVVVTSATGIKENYAILITQDDGSVHSTHVAKVSGTTIYITDALTDDAASGNAVEFYDDRAEDPQIELAWSDDGGNTWSSQHARSMGKRGQYGTRAIWRRLGRSRERVYETTISAPCKVAIIGANLEATKGIS